MELKKIYDKKNNIFQSEAWAEFQKAVGREQIEIDGFYLYREKLMGNKQFLYIPKGGSREQILKIKDQRYNSKIKNFKNVIFVRIEPTDLLGSHPANAGNDPFWRPVTKNSILSQQYSPMQTLVLDLTKDEEELLKQMKSKHRYNIRLAEKKGVKVRQGSSKKDVDDFYKLSLEVTDRDSSYSPHHKSYYEKMIETLGEKGSLQIFTAESEGKAFSSIIVLFYNETAIYLHGASSNEGRELMPNHLVQWTAIREAKKRGCKYYDFWGIAVKHNNPSLGHSGEVRGQNQNRSWPSQDDSPSYTVDEAHSWAGISKFKLGFVKIGETGEILEFPGAYDLPISKFWYNGLSVLNWVRKRIKK